MTESAPITISPFELKFLVEFIFPNVPQTEMSQIDMMASIRKVFDKIEDVYLVEYNKVVDKYYVKVTNKEGKEELKMPQDKIDQAESECGKIILNVDLTESQKLFVHGILYAFPKMYKSKDGTFGLKGKDDILNFVSLRDKF